MFGIRKGRPNSTNRGLGHRPVSLRVERLERRLLLSVSSPEPESAVIQNGEFLTAEIAPLVRAGQEAARNAARHPLAAEPVPFITTAGDPANYVTPTGTPLDGVADLIMDGMFRCTGTLLPTGRHVLSAAHCFVNESGPVSSITARFDLPGGSETIPGEAEIHGLYDFNTNHGNDIAIVTLDSPVTSAVPRFDIYRNSDEVFKRFEVVGYGLTGQGVTDLSFPSGTKRNGENRFDALGEALNGTVYLEEEDFLPNGLQLVFDFDDGFLNHDASGVWLGIIDLGLGTNEVSTAPGDSGGPSFIDGKIAAVTSFGQGFLPWIHRRVAGRD